MFNCCGKKINTHKCTLTYSVFLFTCSAWETQCGIWNETLLQCMYSCQSLPALAKLRPQAIRVLYSVTELPARFEIWLQCRQNCAIIMSNSPRGREQGKERDRGDIYASSLRSLHGVQIFSRHGVLGWPATIAQNATMRTPYCIP